MKRYYISLNEFEIDDMIKLNSRITIHKKDCDIIIYYDEFK